MSQTLRLAAVAAALACTAAFSVAARSITLPPDAAVLRPSALPGYARAQANCVTCHSAEYMIMQPPNAGRPYWDAMTKRMKAVFKAPLDDAETSVVVDYLASTYGNKTP